MIEIERKYLLAGAPPAAVLAAATTYAMAQTYLNSPAGSTRRVRCRRGADGVRYFLTEKRPLGGLARAEDEREIDAAEYDSLLRDARPDSGTVVKTRYVVPHGAQTLEIDVFEAPAALVLLEVELSREDETVALPAWAASAIDVSDDGRYTNAALARSLGAR